MSHDNSMFGPDCPDCRNELAWTECETCGGEGVDGHDCGEDCCCCLDPEDNMTCHICGGEGGWYWCRKCEAVKVPSTSNKGMTGG